MRNYLIILCIVLFISSCRQAYIPPPVKQDKGLLVVNGFINSTPGGETVITLSRSKNIGDTLPERFEQNAQVFVESNTGQSIFLFARSNGVYSNVLPIQSSLMYRLKILTVDGTQYLSDYVPVKQTPPIDSLTWEQPGDAVVYVNTHDPANNTKFYRYDFVETWEYHSDFETVWGVNNGIVFGRDSSNQIYFCWNTDSSKDIILANSLKLSDDVISHFAVTRILQNSPKIGIRYSILVNQYSLTKEAYDFWSILQKNTQQVGSLFDPQPSQLKSNIHNIKDPSEPVLGYVSVTSVEQQRLFISHFDLTNWSTYIPSVPDCQKDSLFIQFPIYTYPNPYFVPYYFVTGGPLYVIPAPCVDCTLHGGTNKKPSFW
jgi:hypothetical protein